jgi:hypothetical protein
MLSRLTAKTEEDIDDHRYVFRSNRLSTDNILSIGEILNVKLVCKDLVL